MAFKVVKTIRQNTAGTRRQFVGTISGPASYTNPGGDSNSAQTLSGGRIKEADFLNLAKLSYSGTYFAYIQYTSDGGAQTFKIRVFVVATGAEVANAVNLSAEKWRIEIQGN